MRWERLALAPVLLPLLGACQGVQSALDPAGRQAERLADLWWLYLGVLSAVYLLVLLLLFVALFRARRRRTLPTGAAFGKEWRVERRLTRILTAWTGGTAVIILTLTGFGYAVDREVSLLAGKAELTVEITAKQWWWQIKYDDPDPSRSFETANELHLPLGVPVRFILKSSDVIHSFWIPNLHGKTDLIPGRDNTTTLVADREGRFRGQCAEFCGLQHAHMALDVTVLPRDRFEAWREAQRAPARAPETEEEKRGQAVFLSSPCVMCHTVRGTTAASRIGPDLTHLAGRASLGAGTLPYGKGNLGGWISDAQSIKPGVQMPSIGLPRDRFLALLAYLDSLK